MGTEISAENLTYEDANALLSGADSMEALINSALSLGSNSIVREAYQIKSRVKDADSLIEKVLSKRVDGDVNYKIQNVRDIVGFRFLALFKPNLVSLVEVFVDFLEKYQGQPTELFVGQSLLDSVEEVKVYQSKATEADYVTIHKFLRGYFISRGFPKDFVKLEEKDTRYSSIHFVVLGQVIKAGQSKTFPIEFQLRTVFEDVWSEIEHKLLYKNSEIKSTDEKFLFGQTQIRSLKTILDGCSDNADSSFMLLAPSSAEQASANTISSNTVKVFESLEFLLPESAQVEVEKLRHRIISSYADVSSKVKSASENLAPETFENLIGEIERFETEWRAKVLITEDSERFEYLVGMEKAAANYWAGQAHKLSNAKSRAENRAAHYFQRAQQVYFDLTGIDGFAADPVLNFRIGQTYRAFGKSDLAITYFEAAMSSMKQGNWRDSGSVFEILIPRHLGYMYWAEAEAIYSNSPGYGRGEDPHEWVAKNPPVQERVLSSLLKAFKATINVDLKQVSKDIDPTRDIETDRALAYNNTLDYGVSFLKFGGDSNKLRSPEGELQFDSSFYERMYQYFDISQRSEERLELLDTFVNAAVHFNDDRRGLLWLEELKKRVLSGDPKLKNKWTALIIQRTVRSAEEAFE